MYAIVWTYTVRPERAEEFAEAYGSAGAWAQLFRTAEGYLGTELLRSDENPEEFVTVDRWESRDAFVGFMGDYAEAYQALERRYDGMCVQENRVGAFTA